MSQVNEGVEVDSRTGCVWKAMKGLQLGRVHESENSCMRPGYRHVSRVKSGSHGYLHQAKAAAAC